MNNVTPVFTPIDLSTWNMASAFYYYTKIAPTTYTVNVSLDVTLLRTFLKEHNLKFFPAYLYLVTTAILRQQELRICVKNDIIGYWNTLTPAYPQFDEETKTTFLLWTEYNKSFKVFYDNYIKDTATFNSHTGILSSKGLPPENSYIISCIPWFSFNSFSLHNHGIKDYYFPSFESCAFKENDGKIEMPLSMTVHHATTEGYHLKLFFECLQDLMNSPNNLL